MEAQKEEVLVGNVESNKRSGAAVHLPITYVPTFVRAKAYGVWRFIIQHFPMAVQTRFRNHQYPLGLHGYSYSAPLGDMPKPQFGLFFPTLSSTLLDPLVTMLASMLIVS